MNRFEQPVDLMLLLRVVSPADIADVAPPREDATAHDIQVAELESQIVELIRQNNDLRLVLARRALLN